MHLTHDDAQPLLEAFLDDQLEIADTLRVAAHLAQCEKCRAWMSDRRQLIARIHSVPLRYGVAPERVRGVSVRLRFGHAHTLQARWYQVLAAGLLLGALGLWAGHALLQRDELGEDFVSAHIRASMRSQWVDIESASHHMVKPWLSSALPFSPPVPELAEQGDVLVGGRADYVEHTRMAVLVYQHGHHRIEVFEWPSNQEPSPARYAAPIDGFRVLMTTVPGFRAAIVSDMDARELEAFRVRWSALAARQ